MTLLCKRMKLPKFKALKMPPFECKCTNCLYKDICNKTDGIICKDYKQDLRVNKKREVY